MLGEVITTIPTIGFNTETVDFGPLKLTVWDIGGQERIRQLWQHYLPNKEAMIFVLDSTDTDRLPEAKYELDRYFAGNTSPCLVLANKQDLPGALSAGQLADSLDLHRIVNQRWTIIPCVATTGVGLDEAGTWLGEVIGAPSKWRWPFFLNSIVQP